MTPQISALFGALDDSGNAARGLFMTSQASLTTDAGFNLAAAIAWHHAAALSPNILGPVRMSIICSLVGKPGHERAAWRIMVPFALAVAVILLAASLLIGSGVI